MAAGYTTPKTWLVSDTELAADWNTYVRDNENSIRSMMYLPSQYASWQLTLVAGVNTVYVSPDLLPSAPQEGWTFYVHTVFAATTSYAGPDVIICNIKDRANNPMVGANNWGMYLSAPFSQNTPFSVLAYQTYANAGASLIPQYTITLQLNSGLVGHCSGFSFAYGIPSTQ